MRKKYLMTTEQPDEITPKEISINSKLPLIEKRAYPRIKAAFPAEITIKEKAENKLNNFRGKTIDLHENGIRLTLDSSLPLFSVVNINVNASPRYQSFQVEASALWNKPYSEDGCFQAGLRFLKIEDAHLLTLKKILADYKLLNEGFALLSEEIRQNLQSIKKILTVLTGKIAKNKNRLILLKQIKKRSLKN